MENTPPPNTTKPEDPVRITNGVLKLRPPPPLPCGVYKECLKNHAASMGGHAVDGCGEFMPSPTSSPSDPTSLRCAACGCHRNFHRRDTEQVTVTSPALAVVPPLIEYHPTHRHHPPQPQQTPRSPNSPSPPPISSTYYPSAPHMLLALSNPNHTPNHNHNLNLNPSPNSNSNSRKRFRTKFTQVQKDKMYELAERLGWKMQRKDEDIINDFCNSIGVEKGVFKVWMHNNKNTLGVKKEVHSSSTNNNNNGIGNGNGNGLGIGINLENVPMGSEYQGYRNSDEVASGHGNNNMNGSSSSSRD